MRALLILALILLAQTATAQTNNGQDAAARLQAMQAVDAARLNQAAQNDTRLRNTLDQAQKQLNEANHPAGKMLEQTRP